MSYPTNQKISPPAQEKIMDMNYFMGIDLSKDQSQLHINKSPEIHNMIPNSSLDLDKMPGILELFDAPLASSFTHCSFYNAQIDDDIIYMFFRSSTTAGSMYKYTISTDTLASLSLSGLGPVGSTKWFTFNHGAYSYIQTGTNFYSWDGTNLVTTVYTPTVMVSTTPAGVGDVYDEPNLLSNLIYQDFSGDGAETDYQLLYKGFPLYTWALVDGVDTVLDGVGCIVDKATGIIDFSVGTAPYGAPSNGTNNVTVLYTHTSVVEATANADLIKKCTVGDDYGGANNLRVFLGGNPDYPGRDWRSEPALPSFYPLSSFDDIGNPNSAILDYAGLYEYQIIIKEDGILRRSYTFDSNDEAVFKVHWLSRDTGASHSGSVQTLDGFPVFLSKKGMYQIVSVDPNNERNVIPISNAINLNNTYTGLTGLIESVEDKEVCSVDYDGRYWLFTEDGEFWMYAYKYPDENKVGNWYYGELYEGVYQSFQVLDRLYVGNSERGSMGQFKETDDLTMFSHSYYDSTVLTDYALSCHWLSKRFEFGSFTNLKLLAKIFLAIKRGALTSCKLWFRSDVNSTWAMVKEITRAEVSFFMYSYLVYSLFSYGGNTFPKLIRHKIKAKKIGFGQIKISNDVLYESLGILNVSFKYLFGREAK